MIFSLHWGENYKWHPSEKFQEFAHALIDHGVDIIFGHSAHHIVSNLCNAFTDFSIYMYAA